jgi:hypothetical protein
MFNSNIKQILKYIIYLIRRKKYRFKILSSCILDINEILNKKDEETFFGYYDYDPCSNGSLILFHSTKRSTSKKPSEKEFIDICYCDENTEEIFIIDSVNTYNWQMGARAIWINNDVVAYNSFDNSHYVCHLYSIAKREIIRTFDLPAQDFFEDKYFLTVNYRRLLSYAPDYAYRNLPKMSSETFSDYANDGIWKVDFKTGKYELLHSIAQVLDCDFINRFKNACHFVNHIMISPDGKGFIFIHRYFKSGVRYDRLIYSDFRTIKVLFSDQYQSHFCWLDSKVVFGYGQHRGKKGFYSINVKSGIVQEHAKLTIAHPKDGHPTVYKKWICIDSYPSLSRMQSLILYNYETCEIINLLEIFHDIVHTAETRCDLHPRFSDDGKKIYIDSIYSGKRRLYRLNIKLSN